MTGWPRLRSLAAVALLLAVAGTTFSPAFGASLRTAAPPAFSGRVLLAVVVAVVLPAVAVAVLRHPRVPAGLAAGGGVVAAALAVVLASPGADVARGPYQLLTAALPVAPAGPPLGAVTALVALATVVAALLVTGSRRPTWALVPPVVVLVLAVALDAGPGEPGGEWALVVVVAVLLALAALARAGERVEVGSRGGIGRSLVGALGLVVVVAAVAGLAAAVVPVVPGGGDPTGRPADLRDLVAAPLVPSERVSPLQQFLALRRGSPLIRFSGRSSVPGVDLPFVTLDRFDGRVWSSDAGYRRAGDTLPVARDTAGAGDAVDVALTADAGSLGWVPRVGVTRSLGLPDGTTLGLDEATGDLVVPAGSRFPSSWRVGGRSGLVAPVGSAAPAVAALTSAPASRTTTVADGGGDVPAEVTSFAAGVRDSTDLRTLQGLVQRLRGTGWVQDDSAEAPGGSGWFQIVALLSAAPPVGAGDTSASPSSSPTDAADATDDGAPRLHRGTPEQYAATFAAVARVLGFDSRVVMGLRPDYDDDGTFTATGEDVWAWPQVRFDGVGWVTFDPTPTARYSEAVGEQAPPPPSASDTASSSTPPSDDAEATDVVPPGRAGAAAASEGVTGSGTLQWAVVAAVVVLVLLFAPGAARGVRRSRRRRASPPGRAVAGAWAEAVGDLTTTGLARSLPARPTTGEVVAAAPEPLQGALRALGDGADRAGYAPDPATASDVLPAWVAADDVRRGTRALVPWWRRAVAWLDPRPLWARRH